MNSAQAACARGGISSSVNSPTKAETKLITYLVKVLTIIILLLLSSCNEKKPTKKFVKAEVVSFRWDIIFGRPFDESKRFLAYSAGDMKTKIIRDEKLLNELSEAVKGGLEPCSNLCQIDIRLSLLLYDSEHDTNPDTLSFGNINKAKYEGKFYFLDEELVVKILSKVDESHLEKFQEGYQIFKSTLE